MLPTVRPAAAYTIMLCAFALAVTVITITVRASLHSWDREIVSLEG